MRAQLILVTVVLTAFVDAQGYFELTNGDHHEGAIAGPKGEARLETAVGRIPLGPDVRLMRRDAFAAHETLGFAVDGLHADNASGHLAVAEFASARGLWAAARKHLNRALEIDPESERAIALAERWAAQFQLSVFEAGQKPNHRKALESWIKDWATRDWVGAAMVAAKARPLGDDLLLHPMLKALKSDKASARWCAARTLARLRRDPERIKPLYRRGVLDPAPPVRIECVRALKATQDPVFCRLFGRGLASQTQAIRLSAAEALAELDMPEGAEPLVRMLSGEAPVAPRNHIVQTTQVAYVKDFDVEVAQNAVIADPVVDVAQDGTILDFAVVSVVAERQVYFAALRRITKQDFGHDVARWREYVTKSATATAKSGG